MMLMLRDDRIIEIFESAAMPPSWIEAVDIENQEYRFCDDAGQRFVGRVKPHTWFRSAAFELQPEGQPDLRNALELLDKAVAIEPNDVFPSVEALRRHLTMR